MLVKTTRDIYVLELTDVELFGIDTKTELRKGNPVAFKEVFTVLYPRLKGYCKLFVADGNHVEDLIQETFIAVWDKRASIKPGKSIESYVFVILRNKCLNFLKTQQRLNYDVVALKDLKVEDLQFLYHLDFIEREDRSLEEQLIESLKQAIDELPDKMKQVFFLCKVKGKKQKEVARELNISVKTVEKHIALAKHQIRAKLQDQYPALLVFIAMILE